MAASSFPPAKLCAPRLRKAMDRPRLFALLDDGIAIRKHVHVSGPPGAGKSTLVGSWLAARKLRGLWYSVDCEDAELPTFFHFMQIGQRSLSPRSRTDLPVMLPEHRGDRRGFARRFARELFRGSRRPRIIVWDNYQEAKGTLDEIIQAFLDELPDDCLLLTLSREPLPSLWAESRVRGDSTLIEWEDLRLHAEEFTSLANDLGLHDDSRIRALHVRTQGWVAAARLLMDAEVAQTSGFPLRESISEEVLFQYFSQHVVGTKDGEHLRHLARLAQVPFANREMCEAMTGNDSGWKILEDMYRRRLLTYRRAGAGTTYEFHPLLREYLLKCGETDTDVHQWAHGWRTAGTACEAAGERELAYEAYCNGQHWDLAARLIACHWEALLTQTRDTTLARWIERLPRYLIDRDALLSLVLGQALISTEPLRALAQFEVALARYRESQDTSGQARTATCAIEAIFSLHSNHAMMDPWLAVLRNRLLEDDVAMPADMALRAYGAYLNALLYRLPRDPEISCVADKVKLLLHGPVSPRVRLQAATQLLLFCTFTGRFHLAQVALTHGDSACGAKDVTEFNRANWLLWRSYLAHLQGSGTSGLSDAREAGDIGLRTGIPAVSFLSAYFSALHCARMGAHEEAACFKDKVFELCDTERPLQRTLANACLAWLALQRNDVEQALTFGDIANRYAQDLGWPSARIHYGIPYLFALIETGHIDDARAMLEGLVDLVRGTALECFNCVLQAMEARIHERAGSCADARRVVQRMWLQAAQSEGRLFLAWLKPWMARYAAWGMEDESCPAVVLEMIRRFQWGPGPPHLEAWPWPVRIRTLGRFEVEVNGQPVVFGRKLPKKPLALLKLLLAPANGGQSEAVLLDRLWPELEGDAGRRALDIALHRLRKWLVVPGAIGQSGGTLWIDRGQVWVDAWAFAAQCERIASRQETDLSPVVQRTIGWYVGEFLPHDDQGWVLPAREALRARYIGALTSLAAQLEVRGDLEAVTDLYRRGVATEPLSERLYIGLMRNLTERGCHAEARATYQALRKLLAATLGTVPSEAVEALRLRIGAL